MDEPRLFEVAGVVVAVVVQAQMTAEGWSLRVSTSREFETSWGSAEFYPGLSWAELQDVMTAHVLG